MLQCLDERIIWKEDATSFEGVIASNVIETWLKFIQSSSKDKEAGGILLGRYYENSSTMLIDELTIPTGLDGRTRTSFYRSSSHDRALKKYWQSTNKVGGLLGLWHTHPENQPNPSHTDLQDLNQQFNSSSYLSNRILYVIVGITHIGLWIAYSPNENFSLGYMSIDRLHANSNTLE